MIQPLRAGDPGELGGHRLLGRIGRGGMGTVYLAESPAGERAAIKVINPELADDDTFRERFRREVESARRVRRFCTAPVLDARLDGEPLYIVTEYVDGPDLDAFVRDGGPMRGAALEHLAVGVATALTAIHGAGVVHRDLKPANVLLSSVGPRVIDFGIARALDTVSGATRTGQFIGTPAYMAPELVMGGTASPASDVFAWGCVVTYAGTGRAPFDGPNVPAVLYRIAHGDPVIDGLDEGLRDLVLRALARTPRERPSAQDLLDRLTGRQGADTARTAEAVGRTWALPATTPAGDATRRPPVATAPPAAAALTRDDAGVTRAAGRRARPVWRRRPWLPAVAGAAGVVVLGTGAFALWGGPDGPPSNTTTVYSDDFADTGSGWSGTTFISGSGYAESGYRIDAGGFYERRAEPAPFKGRMPDRALVSADATVKAGPPYGMLGLFCRGDGDSDKASYYEFLVRADGKGLVIRKATGQSGSRKELARRPSAPGFTTGRRNRLQAACEGQHGRVRLRLWINGTAAADTTDADGPLPNGAAGLVAAQENGGSGGDVQVLFDNVDISSIG